MITRGYGVLLTICTGLWLGIAVELWARDSNWAAGQFAIDSVSVPVSDGAGLRTGLPWANGRFVYEFSPELEQDEQKTAEFEAVCRSLLNNTALHCVRHSDTVAMNDTDYVYVVDGIGDVSFVGRQGGRQIMGVLSWNNPIIVAHEIKHALGWGHEQQHPDRDRFVDILFDNIPPEDQENFLIYDAGNEGPYDFDSIMHYYPTDFALPTKKSIRVKPAYRKYQSAIGQRDHLSATDLREIQEFYGDPSVEWCGIERKPQRGAGGSAPACSLVCQLESDPAIGAWVPQGNCDASGG